MAKEETAGWTVQGHGEGPAPLRPHPLDRPLDGLSYRSLARGAGLSLRTVVTSQVVGCPVVFTIPLIIGLSLGGASHWIAFGFGLGVLLRVALVRVSRAIRTLRWRAAEPADVLVLSFEVSRRISKGPDLVWRVAVVFVRTVGRLLFLGVLFGLLSIPLASWKPGVAVWVASLVITWSVTGAIFEARTFRRLDEEAGTTTFMARPKDDLSGGRLKWVRAQAHVQLWDEPEVAKVLPAAVLAVEGDSAAGDDPAEGDPAESDPVEVGALPIALQHVPVALHRSLRRCRRGRHGSLRRPVAPPTNWRVRAAPHAGFARMLGRATGR